MVQHVYVFMSYLYKVHYSGINSIFHILSFNPLGTDLPVYNIFCMRHFFGSIESVKYNHFKVLGSGVEK